MQTASKIALLTFSTAFFLSACEPSEGSDDESAEVTVCVTNLDCSDAIFCNGSEVCDAESPAANARGCVPGAQPCSARSCDESAATCDGVPVEDCGDHDGDGHFDVACGGSDCDDDDPNRYPGNIEVCDSENVDEDCDPSSFGALDEDRDGFVAMSCCNGSICGDDCDDGDSGVHRLVPEVCDGIDNNCSGQLDEGVSVFAYPDADYDSYGDMSVEPERLCSLPSGMADRGGDCNDLQPFLSPREVGVCNAVDDDCDGEIDEGADLRCNVAAVHAEGGCVTSAEETETTCRNFQCDEGYWDCDGDPQNGCEADLCNDRFNCGTCGETGTSCSNGTPSPPRLNSYGGTLLDSAGNALGGGTVSMLDACQRIDTAVAVNGSWFLDGNGPHRFYHVKKASYYETISFAFWNDSFQTESRLFTEVEMQAWAAAEGIQLDPEKGLIVFTDSVAFNDLNGEEYDLFSVPYGGTTFTILANVRPGPVKVRSIPGCQMSCVQGAFLDGDPDYLDVYVQPSAITFVPFADCGFSCVG